VQIRNVRAPWTALIIAAFVGVTAGNGNALAERSARSGPATHAGNLASAGLVGLHLEASPHYVDVNSNIIFRLPSPRWPGSTTVSLSFLSPHHGFTGTMTWEGQCSCFVVGIRLAARIHPLEQGRAVATATYGQSVVKVATTFMIRGLAPGGKTFAPGGPESLETWVSDPEPFSRQYEHYCAWITTPDGRGVAGVTVRFQVHFADRARTYDAGRTAQTGVACSHQPIGSPMAGHTVTVDVYAGQLRATTSFTPRARPATD